MSFDIGAVVSELGDEAIAQAGEPLGLNKEQSVRVAHAFATHAGMGNQEMIAAVAADTGLDEEVVAAMLKKLIEVGGEKLMDDTGVTAAIDNAKSEAMAALSNAGGGLMGKLFGRK